MGACARLGEDLLSDYVDSLLTPAEEHQVERHLIVCQQCAAAVHQERELMAALRDVRMDAGRHQQLVAGLLSLAGDEPPRPPQQAPMRPAPAMVTAHAPAQYCSARRSVAFTLAAVAGCLGAALTVTQVPAAGASVGDGHGSGTQQPSFSRTVQSEHGTTQLVSRQSHRPLAPTDADVVSISVAVPGH